jgi:hypothetical protein
LAWRAQSHAGQPEKIKQPADSPIFLERSQGLTRCSHQSVQGLGVTQENQPGPEYYRNRATEMRILAKSAQTEQIRKIYLALAANWLRLAEAAEKTKMSEP